MEKLTAAAIAGSAVDDDTARRVARLGGRASSDFVYDVMGNLVRLK